MNYINQEIENLINSKDIDDNDKITLVINLLNKNQLIAFSILALESVLYIYKEHYPKDNRIKNLINFIKKMKEYKFEVKKAWKLQDLKDEVYNIIEVKL